MDDRLHPDRLAALPPGVRRPGYARAALSAGIVHIGTGAFQRAHLGVVNEAAIEATGDLRWGIVGVSLRQPETRDALAPQEGLYTVAIRDADERGPRESLQVVGNLLRVLVAPEDPGAVIEQIAHPGTRIVSLTVTEKGYCHDPASGALRMDHPDVAHDLLQPETARSAIGFLVRGLQRRHARDLGPVTLMSLDNLPANGRLLRGLVLAFAGEADPPLRGWIEARCSFPSSMVDRIVPRTTEPDRLRVSARLGLRDAWPVVGEPYLDWAVEDDFVAGRPDWSTGGARFVAEAEPYERLKLRMVNGTHSALAYLSVVAGWETVDRAVAQPALRRYLEALMKEEIAPTLPALPGFDHDAFARRLLARYANPALAHRTRQIAMDGSQKLPQRLLGTVRDRLAAGAPIERLALGVAAWLHFLRGRDERGEAYPIDDPLAAALADQRAIAEHAAAALPDAAAAERRRTELMCAFQPVFGDLGGEARFIDAVARASGSLRARGVADTLLAIDAR